MGVHIAPNFHKITCILVTRLVKYQTGSLRLPSKPKVVRKSSFIGPRTRFSYFRSKTWSRSRYCAIGYARQREMERFWMFIRLTPRTRVDTGYNCSKFVVCGQAPWPLYRNTWMRNSQPSISSLCHRKIEASLRFIDKLRSIPRRS